MPNWPDDDALFPVAAPLIKGFEGFRSKPYLDSVGVATIGYGTIKYPGGKAVTMQDAQITEDQASGFLKNDIAGRTAQMAPLLTRAATLHQASAMLSLAYNIGVAGFRTSTVLRKFNEGDLQASADAFMMWNKGTVNGQKVVIDGLNNRRTRERTFFLTAD
ncbi:MAG TPA: lysozyme [Rhizomicrobium sp.]|nr:lysozyme [Rhizomicrobium sp.]